MNDNLEVAEWNRTFQSLAKGWKTVAPESNGIVDEAQTKQNILRKIQKTLDDKDIKEMLDRAEYRVSELYDDD